MFARGFTLMETLLAIGLIMLLVSLGSVFSFSYVRTAQLRGAAEIVNAEVRQVQLDAYLQLQDRAHGVKLFDDHVIRFQGTSYAARITTEDVRTDFPSAITISTTDELVFPNGSIEPTTPGTLSVSNSQTAFDITVTSYGIITLSSRAIGS